jgi:hypothetical protein
MWRLSVVVLVVTAWGLGAARAAVIYNQNFETLAPGVIAGQAGWGQTGTGTGNVTNNPGIAYQGNQYLTMAGGSGLRLFDTTLEGVPITYQLELSLHVRFENPGSEGLRVLWTADAGPDHMADTFYNAVGDLYEVPSFTFLGASIAAGQWYNAVYRVDAVAQTYNFRVIRDSDSAVILNTNRNFPSSTPPTTALADLMFLLDDNTGTSWLVDNITIMEVIPEPATAALWGSGPWSCGGGAARRWSNGAVE